MLVPMSPADSMFLVGETREQPMHVGGLELFDPPQDGIGQDGAGQDGVGQDGVDQDGGWDVLALYERLRAQPVVNAHFRKRVRRSLTTGGLPGWSEDADVDLDHHVRHSALPKPGRIKELLALVSRLHGTPLDRSRPLWEFHLIEGLEDGRLALYTKVHHSVMDGISAMRLGEACLSDNTEDLFTPPWAITRKQRPEVPEQVVAHDSNPVQQIVGAGQSALHLAEGAASIAPALATTLLRGLRGEAAPVSFSAPRTIFNTSISGSRRFAAQDWPLERLRRIAKSGDYTLNDVVLTMCSGALRSYLLDFNALPDAPLIALVPVSLRDEQGGREGNAIGMTMCNLGTHRHDAGDRLEHVHRSMADGKAALAAMTPLQILMMSALGMSPMALNLVFPLQDVARPPFNLIISNVPGPRGQTYLDGGATSGMYPLSIPFQGQALNITCTTYGDDIGFGLVGCRRRVPHLQRLLGLLEDEVGALERAVGVA